VQAPRREFRAKHGRQKCWEIQETVVRHGENHGRGKFQGNVLKHGEFMVTGGIQEN
jgi:hypothetical protein